VRVNMDASRLQPTWVRTGIGRAGVRRESVTQAGGHVARSPGRDDV
jgi:hypothetical protein